MRLGKDYGTERLEAACRRAVAIGGPSFKGLKATLRHGLDRQGLPASETSPATPAHPNLRGPEHYH
jgi:hypothetical protein